MAMIDRNFTFATNGTVTANDLHNLIDSATIYQDLITGQVPITSVGTNYELLIADGTNPNAAPNAVTVYDLFEDALSVGTYTGLNLTGALTYGTATGNRTVSTSATITTGTIQALTTGTTTSTNEVVTNGTITNLSATTSTFLGTITGSTNVVNIGSGQIYKDATGNVGIGVTSPISSIHAKQATPVSKITLEDLSTNRVGQIGGGSDGNGGFLSFLIGNNGGSITEAMRIDSSRNVLVGKTSLDMDVAGSYSEQSGRGRFTTNSALDVLTLNRQDSDGVIVEIRQANTVEGSISVSGTTVSYNGGHLSRWSQLLSGQRDASIKKGTVMSNLNEMCEWFDKDGNLLPNEQLNKVKVSDIEGESNVAGVFVNWDDDDKDNPFDLNMAMTGDMIIRIAQGTSVNRGDLLMSAGNGTAKPQGDDISRSKTIAKVTSTHVTCTYEDGSYCVPCVLMAC